MAGLMELVFATEAALGLYYIVLYIGIRVSPKLTVLLKTGLSRFFFCSPGHVDRRKCRQTELNTLSDRNGAFAYNTERDTECRAVRLRWSLKVELLIA